MLTIDFADKNRTHLNLVYNSHSLTMPKSCYVNLYLSDTVHCVLQSQIIVSVNYCSHF